MIGLFSDSHGDLKAFSAAYDLLRKRGAKRFFFLGGRYTDLDEWILLRKQEARGDRPYGDEEFLVDIAKFLASQEQSAKTSVRKDDEDPSHLKDRFVRVPERDCLHYRDPTVPRKVVDMLGPTLCCVVHDKNDLVKEDLLNANVFIHGNQSEPKVVQIGSRYFINPGKLTGAAEQSCGLLQFSEGELDFSAFTLDGRCILEGQAIRLARRNKTSAE